MKRYWVTLVSGEYGYMFAMKTPLPGTWGTCWVEQIDGSIEQVYGRINRVW